MRNSCQESRKQTVGRSFSSTFGKRVKKEVRAWTWFTQSGLYKDCTRTVQRQLSNIQGLVSLRIICKSICLGSGVGTQNTECLRARPLQHRGHFHCQELHISQSKSTFFWRLKTFLYSLFQNEYYFFLSVFQTI